MSDPYALSVVMPVYHGVDPEHLRRALDSVYGQSRPAAEVVLVEDGPLHPEHDRILSEFDDRVPPMVRVKLPENRGAAVANQAGIEHASSDWIAKMDADDIAVVTRFEKQVALLNDGSYDLIGSAMTEFSGEEAQVVGVRRLPTNHDAMLRYMRVNNPINHPTSVYRRSMALDVGGYQALRFMQDYDLFARMAMAGARMHNLEEPLVLFRADPAMFRRRRSRAMFRCEVMLQRRLRSYGLISYPRSVFNLVVRSAFRLLPEPLLRRAYALLFRRR